MMFAPLILIAVGFLYNVHGEVLYNSRDDNFVQSIDADGDGATFTITSDKSWSMNNTASDHNDIIRTGLLDEIGNGAPIHTLLHIKGQGTGIMNMGVWSGTQLYQQTHFNGLNGDMYVPNLLINTPCCRRFRLYIQSTGAISMHIEQMTLVRVRLQNMFDSQHARFYAALTSNTTKPPEPIGNLPVMLVSGIIIAMASLLLLIGIIITVERRRRNRKKHNVTIRQQMYDKTPPNSATDMLIFNDLDLDVPAIQQNVIYTSHSV